MSPRASAGAVSVAKAGRDGTAVAGPKVLQKALRVLDLFTAERPSWSVTEVARELELPTATAHRILRSLETHSYLNKTDARYRLGFAAVDLGRRAIASVDLRRRLAPALRELARDTEETVLLTIYDEARRGSLCVDRIESTQSLRLSLEIGRVTPIHAGASAKALLAFLEEPIVEEALAGPLEKLAPRTITDPRKLRRELAEIRSRGYAASLEENDAGAWGLAAPIRSGQAVVASVGFAAPMVRHSETTVRKLAKATLAAARESEALLAAGGEAVAAS